MAGNLSNSMRNNYDTHGVSGYYQLVAESYRNPHFRGLTKVLHGWLDRYLAHELSQSITILDLAAGSGEATEAILLWQSTRWPSSPAPPAPSSALPPPRFPSRRFTPHPTHAPPPTPPCPTLHITASDPFTSPAYLARTGLPCLSLSFADVANGLLPLPPAAETPPNVDEPPTALPYDVAVISFALHLVPTSSQLWALLSELAKRAKWLVVIAPHKKPDVKESWGWQRWDPKKWEAAGMGNSSEEKHVGGVEGDGFEIVLEKVRLRCWKSEEFLES